MNNAPITQADTASLCYEGNQQSITVNVLANDSDPDPNDTIYLTHAQFIHVSDTNLATITVNAGDSTIMFTMKSNVTINDTGHVFEIIYDVKDNGMLASQCATGILTIKVIPLPTLTTPLTAEICSGALFTYTAITTNPAASVSYTRYYKEEINNFNMGVISDVLENTSAVPLLVVYEFTMTVNDCSNKQNLVVTVFPNATPEHITANNDTICDGGEVTLTAFSALPDVTYNWYDSQTSTTSLSDTASYTVSGITWTQYFYVAVSGTGFCENAFNKRKQVLVTVHPYITADEIIISDTSVCFGTTATLTPTIADYVSVDNPVFHWYTSQIEETPFHTGPFYAISPFTGDSTFYIALVGDNYCENDTGTRKAVAVTMNPEATFADIESTDTTICYGTTATVTVSTSNNNIENPVFYWYTSIMETEPFHTGSNYTTSNLIVDSIFYIAVSGDNYCENTIKGRKSVTVKVNPLPDFEVITDTTVCTMINLSNLISNPSANVDIYFYQDAQGNTQLSHPLVWILSDTMYYVRAMDRLTGCMSVIQTINIHQGVYPVESPITGKHVICIDETTTLTNTAAEGGVWSISNPSISEIVSQTANSVEVKGKTTGVVYVSYSIGSNTTCQTKVTFEMKVIPPTIPEIIIGIERE
jgi:hypothetical protein